MKNIGIICEYNPFHNGHLFHINKIKEMFPDSRIIAVMSGNFTQRGDASIIDKWDKTELSLFYGVDLVVELPFVFASQGADIFARSSIEILSSLNVDYLVFGSETNNIDVLSNMASAQFNKKYDKLVKEFLDEGINYPTALSKALYEITGKKIDKPNDILGITYIREIIKQKSSIEPICIKRNNDYNSVELNDSLTSATSIRYALFHNEDVSTYVPEQTNLKLKNNLHFIDNYFNLLKYKVLTDNDLSKYQTVDEGIENRILKYIVLARDLNELILKVKTKRYTYNKLNRMFTHIICNFTKEEAKSFEHVEYIRVLGFNSKGRNYLNEIKKDISIPIITNFSSIKSKMLDIEYRATCVYASTLNEKDKIELITNEYKNSPIIR